MSRFLAHYEIEAHLYIKGDQGTLRYPHPGGRYIVILNNLDTHPGKSAPLMSALIICEAASLEDAKDASGDCLRDFLDYFAIVTNGTFKIHRIVQIYNWEQTEGPRECLYYTDVHYHDVPIPALDRSLLETISIMQSHNIDPRLGRCLKWFRRGIHETNKDDQFLLFFLVIEIVAQVVKDVMQVPTKCQYCGNALHCQHCNTVPHHRPFPRQAIEQLFEKHVQHDWKKACELCLEARNRLTHGDDLDEIEKDLGVDLGDLVDNLGRVAWATIMNQFIPGLAGKKVAFLHTNRYVHVRMTAAAHMSVGLKPNFDNPKLEDFPKFNIDVQRSKVT